MNYIYVNLLLSLFLLSACGGGGGDTPVTSTSSSTTDKVSLTDSDICGSSCSASDFKTTEYYNQKGLDDIHAAEAYNYLLQNSLDWGGDDINIAIVDTGTHGDHIELYNNYDSADSVGDGTGDDQNGHGTHVAGIAAAVLDGDSDGMHGVAPRANIVGIAYRGIYGVDEGTWDFASEVISSEATVVNMSFGAEDEYSYNTSQLESILADSTIGTKVVLVASAGNSRFDNTLEWNYAADNPLYPAANATDSAMNGQMLAVAALNTSSYYLDITFSGDYLSSAVYYALSGDIEHNIAYYSNYCGDSARYCLAAPGGDALSYSGDSSDYEIYSTYYDASNAADNTYESLSGTSMAAPHVAGAAAILQAAWPSLTGAEVVQILLETADYLDCDDLELPSKGSCTETTLGAFTYNDVTGWGALDLYAAVSNNGESELLSTTSLDEDGYNLDLTNLNISASLASKLKASSVFNNAVFFDYYNRDYKANLADKLSVTSKARQTVNFTASNDYKNIAVGSNFVMAFSNHSSEDYVERIQLQSDEEYNDYSLQNMLYQMRFNDVNIALSFSENYQKDSTDNLVHKSDDIYNFNQEDRFGLQMSKLLTKSYNFKLGLFQDNNGITEIHNTLNIQKKTLDIDLSYSYIDSKDNLIGITGSEGFELGSNNKQHVFGINIAKYFTEDVKAFFEYKFLFGDTSNNSKGILRNFRDIEENSILLGFNKSFVKNDIAVFMFMPTAITSGFVDVDVAVGRDANSVIRASETINLKEQDREVEYGLIWSKLSSKGGYYKVNYSYIDNFAHIDGEHDQLLYFSYSVRLN